MAWRSLAVRIATVLLVLMLAVGVMPRAPNLNGELVLLATLDDDIINLITVWFLSCQGELMFAINHAATAVLIRRRYPEVPLLPILISVQAMEMLWVVLNYLGIERTAREAVVR